MYKRILTVVFAMVFGFQGFIMAADTQVDSLIQKLVEKGILSSDEAGNLKNEIAYDAKSIQETNMKKDIPQWVQDTKLTGDFRIRNQYEQKKNGSTANGRDRARIRARLGVETKIADQYKMAIGIATDGGGARSNNQTLDSSFSKGNVVLNYAYGQYMPNSQSLLTAGQMKNPIYEPMEFLWDGDITPTGGAGEFKYKISDTMDAKIMGGAFVVKELNPSNADPFIYVVQSTIDGKLWDGKADYKFAGTFQAVTNATNTSLGGTGNTKRGTNYVYSYKTPIVSADFGISDPFGEQFPIYIPRIGIFGEYARNPQPNKENQAWMSGAYLGNSKVANKGAWKAVVAYKSLAKDAFLDILPDSDFYGGTTGVRGYETTFEYGLSKNITLAVDYYHTRNISGAKNPESVLQTDLNWKF